jgi:ABC-type thiamine transport system ATPase subunit
MTTHHLTVRTQLTILLAPNQKLSPVQRNDLTSVLASDNLEFR